MKIGVQLDLTFSLHRFEFTMARASTLGIHIQSMDLSYPPGDLFHRFTLA